MVARNGPGVKCEGDYMCIYGKATELRKSIGRLVLCIPERRHSYEKPTLAELRLCSPLLELLR